jgi:rhamnosyltransferase
MILTEKICAIIITFNPEFSFSKNISSIFNKVDHVVVIDNKSCDLKKLFIEDVTSKFNNINTIYNEKNMGIAFALNVGVKYAISLNYEWVVTLDQDSFFEEGALQQMINFANLKGIENNLGIVAPSYLFENSNQRNSLKKIISNRLNYTEPSVVITSGNLVNLKIFQHIGMFKEDYFIDYVDFEFCLRIRSRNYKIYQLNEVFLNHCLGTPSKRNFLGFTLNYSIHSPKRIFFKYRNRMATYKIYFHKFPLWCILDALEIPKEILKIILFDASRFKSIYAILCAISGAEFSYENSTP